MPALEGCAERVRFLTGNTHFWRSAAQGKAAMPDERYGHAVIDRWIAQMTRGLGELVADLLVTLRSFLLRATTQNYLHYDGAQR